MKKSTVAGLVSLATILAISSSVLATSITDTVSRTAKKTQTYTSGTRIASNTYDYGTFLPNDDAYIMSSAQGSSNNKTYVLYSAYGSGAWYAKSGPTTSGNTKSYVIGELSGVDYFEGGSYAKATIYSDTVTLTVVN